jgi:hypothetical protein
MLALLSKGDLRHVTGVVGDAIRVYQVRKMQVITTEK